MVKPKPEVETLKNNAKVGCKVDFLKNWLFTSFLEQWLKGTFSILVKKAAHAQWNLYQTEHVHCVHCAVDLYKKVAAILDYMQVFKLWAEPEKVTYQLKRYPFVNKPSLGTSVLPQEVKKDYRGKGDSH
jgi:hypothetical protein